jgi:hypothetical protein
MQKPSVAVVSADRLFERLITNGSPGLRIPLVSAGRTSSASGVVALDVLQRPKPAVEVISVLRGKGVVGLSVGNIIVNMAGNAAK